MFGAEPEGCLGRSQSGVRGGARGVFWAEPEGSLMLIDISFLPEQPNYTFLNLPRIIWPFGAMFKTCKFQNGKSKGICLKFLWMRTILRKVNIIISMWVRKKVSFSSEAEKLFIVCQRILDN